MCPRTPEKIARCRQHQCHGVAAPQAPLREFCRDAFRRLQKFAERERWASPLRLRKKSDACAMRLLARDAAALPEMSPRTGMPSARPVNKTSGACTARPARPSPLASLNPPACSHSPRPARRSSPEPCRRPRVHPHRAACQTFFSQPQQQFHAFQAAQPPIFIQMRRGACRAQRADLVTQLGDQFAHNSQHAFFVSACMKLSCGRHHEGTSPGKARGVEGLLAAVRLTCAENPFNSLR